MDDFRRPQRPTYNNTGYSQTRPGAQQGQNLQSPNSLPSEPEQVYTNENIQNSSEFNLHNEKPKSRKGLVFALVLFIILFITSTAIAGWLYLGQQETQKEIDELNADVKRLTQKVQSLDYDNYDLNNKLKLATDKNAELQKVAEDLKNTCGNACSDIVIPE